MLTWIWSWIKNHSPVHSRQSGNTAGLRSGRPITPPPFHSSTAHPTLFCLHRAWLRPCQSLWRNQEVQASQGLASSFHFLLDVLQELVVGHAAFCAVLNHVVEETLPLFAVLSATRQTRTSSHHLDTVMLKTYIQDGLLKMEHFDQHSNMEGKRS